MVFLCHAHHHRRGGSTGYPQARAGRACFEAGAELEVRVVDGHIEIEVPPTAMRLEETDYGVVAVADREMPLLTAQMVRDTLDQVPR
jgi:hypothetical protein